MTVIDLRDTPEWRHLEDLNENLPAWARIVPPQPTYDERDETEPGSARRAADVGLAHLRMGIELAREWIAFLQGFVLGRGSLRQYRMHLYGELPPHELDDLVVSAIFGDLADMPTPPCHCPTCGMPLKWTEGEYVLDADTKEGRTRLLNVSERVNMSGGWMETRRAEASCDCGEHLTATVAYVARPVGPLPEYRHAVLIEKIGGTQVARAVCLDED